jgi:hypothetical protein
VTVLSPFFLPPQPNHAALARPVRAFKILSHGAMLRFECSVAGPPQAQGWDELFESISELFESMQSETVNSPGLGRTTQTGTRV